MSNDAESDCAGMAEIDTNVPDFTYFDGPRGFAYGLDPKVSRSDALAVKAILTGQKVGRAMVRAPSRLARKLLNNKTL
jgi:hypothetical protein